MYRQLPVVCTRIKTIKGCVLCLFVTWERREEEAPVTGADGCLLLPWRPMCLEWLLTILWTAAVLSVTACPRATAHAGFQPTGDPVCPLDVTLLPPPGPSRLRASCGVCNKGPRPRGHKPQEHVLSQVGDRKSQVTAWAGLVTSGGSRARLMGHGYVHLPQTKIRDVTWTWLVASGWPEHPWHGLRPLQRCRTWAVSPRRSSGISYCLRKNPR